MPVSTSAKFIFTYENDFHTDIVLQITYIFIEYMHRKRGLFDEVYRENKNNIEYAINTFVNIRSKMTPILDELGDLTLIVTNDESIHMLVASDQNMVFAKHHQDSIVIEDLNDEKKSCNCKHVIRVVIMKRPTVKL